MYGDVQESGLNEIIPLICTSAIRGPYPMFSHPEFPQGCSLMAARWQVFFFFNLIFNFFKDPSSPMAFGGRVFIFYFTYLFVCLFVCLFLAVLGLAAVCRVSLVGASRGYSLLRCTGGFSLLWLLLLQSTGFRC